MIAYLQGKVINKNSVSAIVLVSGIGYSVALGESLLSSLKINQEVNLFIHHRIREDQNDLYGFANQDDLELFEQLLSVSGVGPKSALAILNLASADEVREAVIRGEAGLLTKVTGVGKKTAERVVLELKGKITKNISGRSLLGGDTSGFGDEIDALITLGYSLVEAREALNAISQDILDSGERVKAALRNIRR